VVVSWSPASLTVPVGQDFSMDVLIENANNVGHTPFWIVFNKDVIEVLGLDEGEFMSKDGNPVTFMHTVLKTGRVVVGLARHGRNPGVSGSGRLVSVRMRALAPGTTALSFTNNNVRDPNNRRLQATFVPGSVAVE
jgi:general secretion pathway protein D